MSRDPQNWGPWVDRPDVNSPAIKGQYLPSVLWHCWLGVRKSIQPVKNWAVRYWSEMQMNCIWSSWCQCYHIIYCFIKMQNDLTFLMPVYPLRLSSKANVPTNFTLFEVARTQKETNCTWNRKSRVPVPAAMTSRWPGSTTTRWHDFTSSAKNTSFLHANDHSSYNSQFSLVGGTNQNIYAPHGHRCNGPPLDEPGLVVWPFDTEWLEQNVWWPITHTCCQLDFIGFFMHSLTSEGKGIAPFMLAVWYHYSNSYELLFCNKLNPLNR